MTALLASVASLAEARAIEDCVDVVDLKDPHAGALGALTPQRVARIVRGLRGRGVVSAALGEWTHEGAMVDAGQAMAACGVDFVKIGLADPAHYIDALCSVAARLRGARLVAVLFADRAPSFDVLEPLARAGFAGAMLDTADKRGGTLLDCLPLPRLQAFVEQAHALGMFAGLAGSLRESHLPGVLACRPDFIGLRGALCENGNRTAAISRAKTEAIAKMFPAANPVASGKLQWRLSSAGSGRHLENSSA